MTIITFLQASPGYLIASVAVLGLIVGSFLNVVIHRLPRLLERQWRDQCLEFLTQAQAEPKTGAYNLAWPGSHCPHCLAAIRPWDNIPLLSFILLRGRCRSCGAAIAWRYPLVEFLSALLSGFLAWRLGLGWPLLAALVFSWSLIVLCFIDLEQQLLPDQITLPLLWLGLLFNLENGFIDLPSAVIGAAAGYLLLWSIYHAYRLLRGKEGFGYGDFKLLAALGAWLGWQLLPLVVLLASLSGALVGIGLILLRRHHMQNPLPFGPYLAIAGWVGLVWGQELLHAYFNLAGLG